MTSDLPLILAPLRGVTIRCFREVFAEVLCEAGFTEVFTPFICANPGLDPLKDRELASWGLSPKMQGLSPKNGGLSPLRLTPQFIGKDPESLRFCLKRIRSANYDTADLNCGCPFPMVRNKGRGSGLLRTPDVLRRMLEVGCEEMGAGRFSIKVRLGVDRTDELLELMPLINEFPLRFMTVHARTARQMYEGTCDKAALESVIKAAKVPVVLNGDITLDQVSRLQAVGFGVMVGRPFLRALGERPDIGSFLDRYVAASRAELCGDRPVLGRLKELLAYWQELPSWRRKWQIAKLARNLDEIRLW